MELDPLSSRAVLGLMTALDSAGERAEALRCGDSYGELTRSELGADLPPELSQWIERHRHLAGNGAGPSHQPPATTSAEVTGNAQAPWSRPCRAA